MRFVWTEAFERQRTRGRPVLYAIIPHGVAPLGITAYPAFSRLSGGALCR